MKNILSAAALTMVLGAGAAMAQGTGQPAGGTGGTGGTGTGSETYGTQQTHNDDQDWGWIGLIGLAGLAGLKRRNETRDVVRPAPEIRATTTTR